MKPAEPGRAEVYWALGVPDHVKYLWPPGDHDFRPETREAAVQWLRRWLGQ